jgi:hypothetical protein
MPQCKKDGCREQAIYHPRWGHKRYCEAHGHAYADKRDTALVARAKMNDCESGISPSCEGKVRPSRWDQGITVCRWCEEEVQELQRQHEYETRRQERYDNAQTVEDLKQWIEEYML